MIFLFFQTVVIFIRTNASEREQPKLATLSAQERKIKNDYLRIYIIYIYEHEHNLCVRSTVMNILIDYKEKSN